ALMASRFVSSLLVLGIAGLAALSSAAPAEPKKADPKEPPKPVFARDVAPVLNKYCVTCHKSPKPRAGFALDVFTDDASALKNPAAWEKVSKALREHAMPPEGKPKPPAAHVH